MFLPAYTLMARRGCRGIAPHILNFDTGWKWVNLTPWPLYHRKRTRYLLIVTLGGPQSQSGRYGCKRYFAPTGILSPDLYQARSEDSGSQVRFIAAVRLVKLAVTRVMILQDAAWAPGPVWTGAENLAPPPGIRTPDRPACSESLYRRN